MPVLCYFCGTDTERAEEPSARGDLGYHVACGQCGPYWIAVLFVGQLSSVYSREELARIASALRRLSGARRPRPCLSGRDDVESVLIDADGVT
jgi:hypothetical protein